jgi:hypothetical protein
MLRLRLGEPRRPGTATDAARRARYHRPPTMATLEHLLQPVASAQFLTLVFLAILFVQSGLDKIIDFRGNLGWLKGHFAKSPVAGQVMPMLVVITLTETAAGVLAGVGAIVLAMDGSKTLALYACQLCALNIVMLFFGQRLAKDYAGAASLAPYFIVSVGAIVLMSL